MIYWLIGQPGCGKTTLAKLLKRKFDIENIPSIHLDGDDLRKIFGTVYSSKENFTKEYRIEQTRILQRFVAHVADQGITMILSTVNPYKDIREEFKKSRVDVREVYVSTSDIRGREKFHVKDFEIPTEKFCHIQTGGELSEEPSFNKLLSFYE